MNKLRVEIDPNEASNEFALNGSRVGFWLTLNIDSDSNSRRLTNQSDNEFHLYSLHEHS